MIKQKRLPANDRKKIIIKIAMALGEKVGYANVERNSISRRLRLTPSAINVHFGNLKQIQNAVMRTAISENNLNIIAQGLANRDRIALHAPLELKRAAAEHLTKSLR